MVLLLSMLWRMKCVLLLLFGCVVMTPISEFLSSGKVQVHVLSGTHVQGVQYKHFKPWGVVQSKYWCTMSVLCSKKLSLAVQGNVHISTVEQGILTILFAVHLLLAVLGRVVCLSALVLRCRQRYVFKNRFTKLGCTNCIPIDNNLTIIENPFV